MVWSARAARAAIVVVAGLATQAVAQEPAHVAASAEFVRALSARTIGTLTEADLPLDERRRRLRTLFHDGLALKGIARFALGRYWRRATPAQQDDYVALFEEVIVRTWVNRFTEYSGQKFEVTGAVDVKSPRRTENAALVRSVFFTDAATRVNIDWRVASKGTLYKIVDVLVEGVSMANTQRDEFAAVIRKEGGVDGLLAVLRTRRDALPPAGSAAAVGKAAPE